MRINRVWIMEIDVRRKDLYLMQPYWYVPVHYLQPKWDARNLPRAIPRENKAARLVASGGNMSGPREKIRPHC